MLVLLLCTLDLLSCMFHDTHQDNMPAFACVKCSQGIVSDDFGCTTAMVSATAAEVAPCRWEKFCCGAINNVRQCFQTSGAKG